MAVLLQRLLNIAFYEDDLLFGKQILGLAALYFFDDVIDDQNLHDDPRAILKNIKLTSLVCIIQYYSKNRTLNFLHNAILGRIISRRASRSARGRAQHPGGSPLSSRAKRRTTGRRFGDGDFDLFPFCGIIRKRRAAMPRGRSCLLTSILSGRADLGQIVALLIALVLGISVHEFSHAAAATWLGDPLPRRQGRLTLAPAAHLDVMGSLMFIIAGFGWGKPVQYTPYALRAGPRSGPALVALAGPVSNVILAALFAVPARLLEFVATNNQSLMAGTSGTAIDTLYLLLIGIVYYNLILGLFNLIPIFPLDGFSILLGVLPPEMAYRFEQTRQWGMFLLLALILLGSFGGGGGLLGAILDRPVSALLYLLTGVGS
jgi:Zn-dependent protease